MLARARYHFLLAALELIHEKNSRVRPCELEHFQPPSSLVVLLTILADQRTGFSLRSCLHLVFSISGGSCDGVTHTVLLILSLLVDAGCNVGTTALYNTDVGDVGVAGPEEFVDTLKTTIGTESSVLHCIRLRPLMSCGFWPVIHSTEYP